MEGASLSGLRDPAVLHHAALDARLVDAIGSIRMLQSLSWPAHVQDDFLYSWSAGQARLPSVAYPQVDYREVREELGRIASAADADHPLGRYLRGTVESWTSATWLLEAAGGADVTRHSIALFGRPGDALPGGGATNIDAARHFISLADELDRELLPDESQQRITAEELRKDLQGELDRFFVHHRISVEIDPELIAKAAAGPTRIRLRGGGHYSEYDRHQLLEHEAYVHSLTALNGREQPYMKSLARTSPRITATQEGLATFAELITGAIDIERMKRISLRIIAIDMALRGADFIQVFRFFLDAGQTVTDSFASAQRVFRGVPLTGKAAFTKDTVYLHGLIGVHTFFRWALRHRRLNLARLLFAGKMTLSDVVALEPMFECGALVAPLYVPPWLQRAQGLAGMLAFSLFANRIRLDNIDDEAPIPGL